MKSKRTQIRSQVIGALRELLKQTGLTQKELAQRLGTTPGHLNLYLTGKSDMHSINLIAILEALGIDLAEILNERIRQVSGRGKKRIDSASIYARLENIKACNRKPLLKLVKSLAVG